MKTKTLNFYAKIMSFVLTLLGFSGCSDNGGAAEYGTPSATFKIKGKVVSEQTQLPILGVRAVMSLKENSHQGDTIYTRDTGSFDLSTVSFPVQSTFYVKLEDTDGEVNGSFQTKLDSVTFTNPSFTGGDGHWYKGEAEKDMGTITLTPKK